MSVLNTKALLIAGALAASASVSAQTTPAAIPRLAPYDCTGTAGAALGRCVELNNAAANPSNRISPSHDCSDMSGAALATCRELNGQAPSNNASGNRASPMTRLRATRPAIQASQPTPTQPAPPRPSPLQRRPPDPAAARTRRA